MVWMRDPTILSRAVEGLVEALIVWTPHDHGVLFANQIARRHLLSPTGTIVDRVLDAAIAQREGGAVDMRDNLPCPVDLHGVRWYVRAHSLDSSHGSIVAHRRTPMTE